MASIKCNQCAEEFPDGSALGDHKREKHPIITRPKPPRTHAIMGSDIGASEGSEELEKARSGHDLATIALERADSQKLFDLYETAVKDQGSTIETLMRVMDMYRKDKPPIRPDYDVIAAMERVSLAAIALARDIALNRPE